MRNKLIALLLCGVMVAGSLAGCGKSGKTDENASSKREDSSEAGAKEDGVSEENPYEEKFTITMTGPGTDAGGDYDTELMNYFEDKFNVELKIMDNGWDSSAERFSLQATGGTLYDVNVWLDFNWSGYFEYVDQGLFKPLPEDWAERWPNLYRMVERGGYLDYLTVDGRVYGITHATYGGVMDVKYITQHSAIYLRKDWAAEVGMSDLGANGTVTLNELKTYLEAVRNAGLTDKASISASAGYVSWLLSIPYGISGEEFVDEGDGYVWTPTDPRYVEFLSTMQEWYAEGLINPDFYLKEDSDCMSEFASGMTAVLSWQALYDNILTLSEAFEQANSGKNFTDCIMLVQPIAEDGTLYAQETKNYWTASVFSPEIDDAVMERALDIMDYSCTEEGEAVITLGVPEADWTVDDSGAYVLQNGKKYTSIDYPDTFFALVLLGYCVDDFTMSTLMPTENPDLHDMSLEMFRLRDEGYIIPYSTDYSVFSGDSKNIYNGSVSLSDFKAQVAVSEEDAQILLTNFIEENREIWEPLLNELNEFAGY